MKRTAIAIVVVLFAFIFASSSAWADNSTEKGWHKGPYLLLMGGMMQAGNDTNVDTNRRFDGKFAPAVGLTFGWDITDWIGPMLNLKYGFDTDDVGNGTADYPIESAREHIINIELVAKGTLLTNWKNISETFKFLPYFKLGGAAHGLYVNAPTGNNKIGSWGAGIALGGGVDFLFKKHFSFGIDITEDLLWLQSVKKTVSGSEKEILKGGFTPQFSLMGTVGYHF